VEKYMTETTEKSGVQDSSIGQFFDDLNEIVGQGIY